MEPTPSELKDQVKKLSPAQRLELVDALLDSLDEPDPALDRMWVKEGEDRLDAYRRGEIAAIPVEEILAKYR